MPTLKSPNIKRGNSTKRKEDDDKWPANLVSKKIKTGNRKANKETAGAIISSYMSK